jgi:hypothetical protein
MELVNDGAFTRVTRGVIMEPNGCWLFVGCLARGYGQLLFDGKRHKAHRLMWQAVHGDIPAGLFVCHRCDVRRCINPDHLFLGTCRDNTRDALEKGRLRNMHTGRTHCLRGHEFTPENTRQCHGRWRSCRVCEKAYKVAHRARRNALRNAKTAQARAVRIATEARTA